MDSMRGPEYRILVVATVFPVVAKIPGKRSENPQCQPLCRQIEPAGWHIDYREMSKHIAPYDQRQEPRKITECCAHDAGAKTVDCIVTSIKTCVCPPVDEQFDEQGEQEQWHGQRDDFHARMVT